MSNRSKIPETIRRAVFVEAGHRCAIPTCGQHPVEIAHIVPWAECKEDEFDNLIALCPNCHTRNERKEIDRKSLQIYKRNLAKLNGRYSELELRILKQFATESDREIIWFQSNLELLISNLLDDGLLEDTGEPCFSKMEGVPTNRRYKLTEAGRELVGKWAKGNEFK